MTIFRFLSSCKSKTSEKLRKKKIQSATSILQRILRVDLLHKIARSTFSIFMSFMMVASSVQPVLTVYADPMIPEEPDDPIATEMLVFDSEFRLVENIEGGFDSPTRIIVDPDGNIYVVDSENSLVQKYDSAGTFDSEFEITEENEEEFSDLEDRVTDVNGNIYVVDSANNRIQRFNSDETFDSEFGTFGSDEGEFDNPTSIAIDLDSLIYVLDSGNNRVQIFVENPEYTPEENDSIKPADLKPAAISEPLLRTANTYEYSFSFGSEGNGNVEFDTPNAIGLDSKDNIYVSDTTNNRIQKLKKDGTYMAKFGSAGNGNGQLSAPIGIAFDSQDNIYVVEAGNNRVQKFDSKRNFVSTLGSAGNTNGKFNIPTRIVIGKDDYMYVVDSGNDRVQKFKPNGDYDSQFGSHGDQDGQFDSPSGIALDSNGNIYVVDTKNHRVQKFNSNGDYESQFGVFGAGNGQFNKPTGVMIDLDDNIFVIDTQNNRVQKFTNDWQYLTQFGTQGNGNGEFNGASYMVQNRNGLTYVLDAFNNKVQAFNFGYKDLTDDEVTIVTEVVDNGGAALTELSIYYSHKFDDVANLANIDQEANKAISPTHIVGLNEVELDSLACGTLYYYRSYATNGDKEAYGEINTFKTTADPSCGLKVLSSVLQHEASFPYNYAGNTTSIAVDNEANIYLLQANSERVVKNDPNFNFIQYIGEGIFYTPYDISIGKNNLLHVADTNNRNIKIFDTSGVLVRSVGAYGTGDGQFMSPKAIASDSEGSFYVIDNRYSNPEVIHKFNSSGSFVKMVTGANGADFFYPDLTRITVDSEDNIYVFANNSGGKRFLKFNSDLEFMKQWDDFSGIDKFSFYSNFLIDEAGFIIIPDGSNDYIRRYDSEGNLLESISTKSNQGDMFMYAVRNMAFGPQNKIYINAAGNNKVKRLNQGVTINENNATLAVKVFDNGGSALEEVGVFYSTEKSEIDRDDLAGITSEASATSVVGVNTINLNDLECNTTYYFRAYATNAQKTSYGEVRSFTAEANEECSVKVQTSTFEYADSFGTAGNNLGELNGGRQIALDTNDNVYIADANNQRIQRFEPDGASPTVSIGGALNNPYGVAVTEDGKTLFVSDKGDHKIKKYTIGVDGSMTYVAEYGTQGINVGQLDEPVAMKIYDDKLYVAEAANRRIQIFEIDESKDLVNPEIWAGTSLAVSSNFRDFTVDFDEGLLFTAENNNVLRKFEIQGDGSVVNTKTIDATGIEPAEFDSLVGVTLGQDGTIYTIEADGDRIQKFDSDLNLITIFGSSGAGNGEFDSPYSMAQASNGQMYVLEGGGNNRVQIFDPGFKDLTEESATIMINVIDAQDEPLVETGIIYSTNKQEVEDIEETAIKATSDVPSEGINEIEIDELRCDTVYYYRAFATTTVETGYGEVLSIRTLAICPLPGTPTDLAGVSGDEEVALSWEVPTDNGEEITSYALYIKEGDDAWSVDPQIIPVANLVGDHEEGETVTYTIEGLTNGTSYKFKLAAINKGGEGAESLESAAVIPLGVPGAPTDLVAISGNGKISLSWVAPENDGGSEITDYVVEYMLDGEDWEDDIVQELVGSDDTEYEVEGLPLSKHVFRVRAINNVGSGAASNEVVKAPIGAPDAPNNFTATRGDEEVELSWKVPDDNGEEITKYSLYIKEGANAWPEEPVEVLVGDVDMVDDEDHEEGNTAIYTVEGLTNGTSYQFKLAAVNDVNEGSEAGPTVAVTPAGKPKAPANLVGVIGHREVVLTWDAADRNGEDVDHYEVYYATETAYDIDPEDPDTWTLVDNNVAPLALTKTVTGLVNTESYYFKVFAVNIIDDGTPAISAKYTPIGTPDAPTDLQATYGDTKVTLTWAAPVNNGGAAITNYEIGYKKGGVVWDIINVNSNATTFTVEGLDNKDEYTFRVTAENIHGLGDPSVTTTETPKGTPLAPANLTGVRGDSKVTLTWPKSDDNGFAITEYVVSYSAEENYPIVWTLSDDNIAPDDPEISHEVAGLTNGTSYYFRVHAVNAEGAGAIKETDITYTPAGVPVAVNDLIATRGNQAVKLDWSAVDDNGDELEAYAVYYITEADYDIDPTEDGNWLVADLNVDPIDLTYTVEGLVNGDKYYFKIYAINTVDSSLESNHASATPAALPSKVANLQIDGGDAKADLTWDEADGNGQAITDYIIEYTPEGGVKQTLTIPVGDPDLTFDNGAETYSYEITGLVNSVKHTFQVLANNAVGAGIPSNSVVVTPYTAPVISNIATAGVTDTEFTVTWQTDIPATTQASYGMAIPYKYTTVIADESPNLVTAHTVEVDNLKSCTVYNFKVYSKNLYNVESESDNLTVVTGGCIAEPEEETKTGSIPTFDGGTITLGNIRLTIPPLYFNNDTNFQILRFEKDAVPVHEDYILIAGEAYDLTAKEVVSEDPVDNFQENILVSIRYNAGDVNQVQEDTLVISYYDVDTETWKSLDNCQIDKASKEVTCETDHFTLFGLYGKAKPQIPNNKDSKQSTTTGASKVKEDPYYTDVPENHPNFQAIEYLTDLGILKGYSDKTYRPSNKINRAEFTKVLLETKYQAVPFTQQQCFPDTIITEWYNKYICFGKLLNIIEGYPDGNFKPAQFINIAESLKITLETLIPVIPRISTGEWYNTYVTYSKNNNLYLDSWRTLNQNISRGEMAEIIYRILVPQPLDSPITNQDSDLDSAQESK